MARLSSDRERRASALVKAADDAEQARRRAPRHKVRSRRDGAAVPLADLHKRLLNLRQGSLRLEPRPYARVASLAEVAEDEVLARVRRLIDERIIRQVTPIFDTRALGY